MRSVVEHRAHQIVHRGIENDEGLATIFLAVKDAGEQHAGLGNNRAAGFEQKMHAERPSHAGNHLCIGLTRRRLLAGVTHAEAAADIQIFQRDPLFAQIAHVSGKPLERAVKRAKFDNLRADVGADSLPADGLVTTVREIEFSRLGPRYAEFVVLEARGDVRMPSGLHVGIDADGDSWRPAVAGPSRRFFNKSFRLRGRLDVELQNPRLVAAAPAVAQRLANFFAALANAREDDALTGDADVTEMLEFAAGDDVEAAAEAAKKLQQREVSVGLSGEAEKMGNAAQAAINFTKGIGDSAPAVDIRGRRKTPGDVGKRHAFAKYFARGSSGLFPGKLRRVTRGINVRQRTPRLAGAAHFTFITTSVRSSERGALCENQSTSFRTRSAISAAEISCCCSISMRSRSVPNSWPSLLLVSAMPSEWKTRMSPDSIVTLHSS